jgi:hypothetical protein
MSQADQVIAYDATPEARARASVAHTEELPGNPWKRLSEPPDEPLDVFEPVRGDHGSRMVLKRAPRARTRIAATVLL